MHFLMTNKMMRLRRKKICFRKDISLLALQEMSNSEVKEKVEEAIKTGAEKSFAEQAKAQAEAGEVGGTPISKAQQEDLSDIFDGFQEAFDNLPKDDQDAAEEAEREMGE